MSKNFREFIDGIRGKKVAVIGIGISNRPLIKYIAKLGADVTACDKKDRNDLGKICGELEGEGIKLKVGYDYLKGLDNFDMIFKTPSLRHDIPELVHARRNGVYITSEMEEFVKYCPAQIIGVTGSDGKTTTTTLIYNMLKEQGYNVWLGGNIGNPLFDRLESIKKEDKVVLELSSFQLMTMDVSPDIAVVTNLSPNHMDIHKSMEEYIDAKKNIFRHQNENSLLVLNLDNDITRNMENEAAGSVKFFSRLKKVESGAYLKGKELVIVDQSGENIVCSMEDVKLPGMHNIENMLAAFSAVSSLCSIQNMKKVASTFEGVEHRIEFVREIDGVKYYNDSIGSSPTRTIASISSFKGKVILIAGGYDKKVPFDKLAKAGMKRVKKLVLLGVTAPKIEEAFKREMDKTGVKIPIVHSNTLKDAVLSCKQSAKNGDVVILSPACASFDMFKNFEERGNKFKEIVNSL